MTVIRKTRRDDAHLLPAIERAAGKAFLVLPDLAWIADDDIRSTDHHLGVIATGESWVAVDENDEPVGFLNAEWRGGRLHIWDLDVRHDLQGRGLGRGLIEHAAQAARSRGAEALTLTTFKDVPWNQPFYEKLGFRALDADALSNDLRTILDDEANHGIPRDRRCAMVLLLHPPSSFA